MISHFKFAYKYTADDNQHRYLNTVFLASDPSPIPTMSFSSPSNHFRHHQKRDEVQDYRVQYPYHPRHQHHDMDERRKYPVQRADTDATLYDSYPYHANRLHTNDDQYGNTDRTEPRKVCVTEYEVYDNVRAPGVKDDLGDKFVDEDINGEAEEFIQMEHKKFNMIKWFSKKSG